MRFWHAADLRKCGTGLSKSCQSLSQSRRRFPDILGKSCCAVLPGDIRSGFTSARRKTPGAGAYGERVARSVAMVPRSFSPATDSAAMDMTLLNTRMSSRSGTMDTTSMPATSRSSATS